MRARHQRRQGWRRGRLRPTCDPHFPIHLGSEAGSSVPAILALAGFLNHVRSAPSTMRPHPAALRAAAIGC